MAWRVSPQQLGRVIERFPDYWDHPDSDGAIAVVKDLLNGIVNSVNAANIVTGPPPSTEEEAFQQNYARDHGPGAAFDAVKDLAPGAPKGTGGLLARGFAEAARNGLPRLPSDAAKQSRGLAGRLQQAIEEQGAPRVIEPRGLQPTEGARPAPNSPGQIGGTAARDPNKLFAVPRQPSTVRSPFKEYGEVPSNPSPSPAPPAWDPSRPFAVPTTPTPQRPGYVGSGGSQAQAPKDPDFRQLSRVSPNQSEGYDRRDGVDPTTIRNGVNGGYNSLSLADAPNDVASADADYLFGGRKGRLRSRKPKYARGDGGSGTGNGWQDDDTCYSRWEREDTRCTERYFGKNGSPYDNEYAHKDFLSGCKQRAQNRRNLCNGNNGQPASDEPKEWGLADEEIYRNLSR
jgi:hypothetical protein